MMITAKELKALRRKQQREQTKQIEKQLHPNLVINGIEIAHEHAHNGRIYFSAWQEGNPINKDKSLMFSREQILRHEIPNEFYMLYKKDFEWLTN